MVSENPPIDCSMHDRLEICCLYRYRLRIATRDGRIVSGTAVNTMTDAGKREWLMLRHSSGDEPVAMDTILQLDVLTPGAKIGHLTF